MLAGVVDHLWQSIWICGAIALMAFIARDDLAELRLWMWRVAALKFGVPFGLLFAVGGWMGFSVPHTADPAPAALVNAFTTLMPFAAPARLHEGEGAWLALLTPAALLGTGMCGYWLSQRLRRERQRVRERAARPEQDADDLPRFPGFFASALFTTVALAIVCVPLLAGAVDDRQRHRQRLILNSLALREAPVTIAESAPGKGWRYCVRADARGVSIHNINIQELIAIVYGVERYSVITNQMISALDPDPRSWLTSPRYDLRADGPVPHPDDFDPYALRQSLTRLLAARFGLEIYLNGDCQPPCGRYGVALSDDPL